MVGAFVSGFRANGVNTSLQVSHLLFADDTLIMCDANSEHIYNLDHILLCLAISELKINLQKSELVVVGEVPNIEELAAILSCRISSFPMKYLGLPLGAPFRLRAIWDGVVERMEKSWLVGKRSTCQKGGVLRSSRAHYPVFLDVFFPSSHY
jgi:hypothetical protein